MLIHPAGVGMCAFRWARLAEVTPAILGAGASVAPGSP